MSWNPLESLLVEVEFGGSRQHPAEPWQSSAFSLQLFTYSKTLRTSTNARYDRWKELESEILTKGNMLLSLCSQLRVKPPLRHGPQRDAGLSALLSLHHFRSCLRILSSQAQYTRIAARR